MNGCVVGGWSGVWESGEDPGWNLGYSTRCCPVLLHRLLIGIMSLFLCGLPKETPVLKNVLFFVVLVPKTRDRYAIIYSTHPGTQTFPRLFLYILLKITAPITSTTCPVFCLHQSICLGCHMERLDCLIMCTFYSSCTRVIVLCTNSNRYVQNTFRYVHDVTYGNVLKRLNSQGHNLCKLKYISLEDVKTLYFQQ